MSTLAIVLVIISAFMHAGWNLLSKRQHPSAAFFLVASLAGAVLLSPALVVYWDTIANDISFKVWSFLIMAGFFMALYYIALAGAYRAGDISVAYPLARSSPIIIVSVATLVLGRGDQVSGLCIAGILFVVFGCFLIPLLKFKNLRVSNYLNMTCGLALIAAVGTAGYTLIDDEALRLLRTNAQITIGNTGVTIIYACLEALLASIWLFFYVAATPKGRLNLRQEFCFNKKNTIFTGIVIQLT